MKSVFALALLLASITTHAASYTITKEDLSSKNYDANIAYPVLRSGVVPASGIINTLIRSSLVERSCGPEGATQSRPYSYSALAGVVALNPVYVGYEIEASEDCGGAHPNFGHYNETYDSVTGTPVDMDIEIPVQNYDKNTTAVFDRYHKELALLIYNAITADPRLDKEECYKGRTRTDVVEELQSFYPSITGLARNKQVVIRTSPPHVATACELAIRVPYSAVSKYIRLGSKLHGWLK